MSRPLITRHFLLITLSPFAYNFPMIRSIIWDVGGTLFNTYPAMTGAFLSALREMGVQAPYDWVMSLARVSQKHCARVLAETYQLDEEKLFARYKDFLRDAPLDQQPPFPGARETCALVLSRGGLNLIATHRAIESVNRLLEAYQMTGLFAESLSSLDGYPRKPDPAMLDALVDHHHLDRAATLTIGDRPIDIDAGKAAGILTCLFGEAKSEIEPDYRIKDYSELQRIIKQSPQGPALPRSAW